MTILYLTFYFEPDLGPGASRNTSLVNELASQLTPADSIHVITTHPNRYASYQLVATSHEEWCHGGAAIIIHRIKSPRHKNGFIDQVVAFMTYYRQASCLTKHRHYDLVVASSSRLFTAFLGARVGRRQRIALFLDIRDLFREAIRDVLGRRWFFRPMGLLIDPLLRAVERYTFGYARHINLVSEGFRDYFALFSQATYSYFTNGIDTLFANFPVAEMAKESTVKTILYAGNIGEGQGLDRIIPQAAQQLGAGYRFLIIGDGGARSKLEKAISTNALSTVELRPPVSREKLRAEYQAADYLFVHLNDMPAFKRVLPSKLFEYGATDKPILAGVAGHAAKFVNTYLPNSIVFPPGDVASLIRQLKETPYTTLLRTEFTHQFQRQAINSAMARRIRQIR